MRIEARLRKEYALAAAAALALGLAVTASPLLAAAASLAAAGALVFLAHPRLAAYAMVLSFAVSVQRLLMVHIGGLDTLSFYKFVMLGAIAVAVFRYGAIRPMLAPAAALALLTVLTYAAWIARGEDMGSLGPLKAFIGLVIPFLLLVPAWRKETAQRIRSLLMWLAPASVAAGAAMQAVGLGMLFSLEFTGVPRLQGANIAAHLGMLAFIGTAVAMYELCRGAAGRPGGLYAMVLINLVILVATGTRGPLLALAPITLVFLAIGLRRAMSRGPLHTLPLLALCGGGAAALLLQLDNYRLRQSEKGLSGRDEAWSYFWEKSNETPLFGHGLGKVLEANDGTLFSGFAVPHNEYLRFFYDSGLIGVLVLLAALVWVHAIIARKLSGGERWAFLAIALGVCVYSFVDNTMSTVQFTAPLCCFLNSVYLSRGGDAAQEVRKRAEGRGAHGENEDRHRRLVGEG